MSNDSWNEMMKSVDYKLKRLVLIIIVFLLFSSVPLSLLISEFPTISSLTVEVRKEFTTTPVSGVIVSLSGPVIGSEITQTNGRAVFSNLPSGVYNISVSLDDFSTESQSVEVYGNTTTFVHFKFSKAYFSYVPIQPLLGQDVVFNGSLSDSSADITEFEWDFGDGENGSGEVLSHVYSEAGSYTVVLTITSAVGTSTYTQQITVANTVLDLSFWTWIVITLLLVLIPLILLPFLLRRYKITKK